MIIQSANQIYVQVITCVSLVTFLHSLRVCWRNGRWTHSDMDFFIYLWSLGSGSLHKVPLNVWFLLWFQIHIALHFLLGRKLQQTDKSSIMTFYYLHKHKENSYLFSVMLSFYTFLSIHCMKWAVNRNKSIHFIEIFFLNHAWGCSYFLLLLIKPARHDTPKT